MDSMSDAEFDAKVGFPVGERYVPKSKLDAAEARLDAAERERDELRAAQQWQPIETAPKDGTRIMVWRKAEDGFESRRLGMDLWREDCWWMSRKLMQPTHWQPLPAPPANHSAPVVEG